MEVPVLSGSRRIDLRESRISFREVIRTGDPTPAADCRPKLFGVERVIYGIRHTAVY